MSSWMLSVDGTHCKIQEPRTVPDKNWYSHMHHKPCVAYEIAVDIQHSKIAWVSGPHQAGETDLVIFRKPNGLKERLPDGFKIVGDKGYVGDEKVSVNNTFDAPDVKIFKRLARARHEDINGRIKRIDILSNRFHHPIHKHEIVFEAVCVIVQYTLDNGHPLHAIPLHNLA
jgi:DDE superfamily endonuclease